MSLSFKKHLPACKKRLRYWLSILIYRVLYIKICIIFYAEITIKYRCISRGVSMNKKMLLLLLTVGSVTQANDTNTTKEQSPKIKITKDGISIATIGMGSAVTAGCFGFGTFILQDKTSLLKVLKGLSDNYLDSKEIIKSSSYHENIKNIAIPLAVGTLAFATQAVISYCAESGRVADKAAKEKAETERLETLHTNLNYITETSISSACKEILPADTIVTIKDGNVVITCPSRNHDFSTTANGKEKHIYFGKSQDVIDLEKKCKKQAELAEKRVTALEAELKREKAQKASNIFTQTN